MRRMESRWKSRFRTRDKEIINLVFYLELIQVPEEAWKYRITCNSIVSLKREERFSSPNFNATASSTWLRYNLLNGSSNMVCENKITLTFFRSLLASASSAFRFSVIFGAGTATVASRNGFRSTCNENKHTPRYYSVYLSFMIRDAKRARGLWRGLNFLNIVWATST